MDELRRAYGARAKEYAALLGSVEATPAADRDLIGSWADGLDGLVADVGCGPGHWTEFLRQHGVAAVGLDPVPEFVALARARFPEASFRLGSARDLDLDGLVGVLAWYSLIHLPPAELPPAVAALAERLRPGGGLIIGFFEGPRTEVFAHAVAPAWFHPLAAMRALAEQAGLEVTHALRRSAPGTRDHGELIAVRPR
ncbi:class I SAM-dependent methyltransferase [Rathayibacter tritici]|uniref:SAM-dependent methyltransferase n=1 Tax=Rathayibacter tritici TaxID=33888 RepID=A0A160KW43_9MICO|nr:class I SAM-dependent methyltransferase [Rathayibacter tritici]AND17959.1 SAM-dependent methyltransferase [Rathayibacter tritici]PPF26799.1 class I SAM-dependent methyltransferase [Rathayibacter tritici]PPF69820.1 class I SAM-dependent methyltransferase [Rathayibacter tritici]PPG09147.1 class I SAM-dependent methyltransferase [Rathayibacter tritici]PPI18148.1 class I SAM-dependent methyltransferase [Rathayibacter tritici]